MNSERVSVLYREIAQIADPRKNVIRHFPSHETGDTSSSLHMRDKSTFLVEWGLEEIKVKHNISAAELSIKGGAYE
jgi:hypothetical protein